jgi:thioredoxin
MSPEPTREEIDRTPGPVVLEFGAEWCEFCQAARPKAAALLMEHPAVRHIRVEDGKGKRLGRSFQVKLWPTFVFLRDGQVVARVVRPSPEELRAGFDALSSG